MAPGEKTLRLPMTYFKTDDVGGSDSIWDGDTNNNENNNYNNNNSVDKKSLLPY